MTSQRISSELPTNDELDEMAINIVRNRLITEFGFTFENATLAARGEIELEESIAIQLARTCVGETRQQVDLLKSRLPSGDGPVSELLNTIEDLQKIMEKELPQQNH